MWTLPKFYNQQLSYNTLEYNPSVLLLTTKQSFFQPKFMGLRVYLLYKYI
jgi:hypothetical protein